MALEALGDKAGAAEMYRHSQSLAPDWAAPGNALAKLSGDATDGSRREELEREAIRIAEQLQQLPSMIALVGLLENTAITIGRLGYAAAAPLAPHLGSFCRCWCLALCAIRDDIEKEHACTGLCEMIRLNPQAPLNCLMQLCEAVGSWDAPPAALHSSFAQILQGYKGSIPPEQWAPFYAAMAPALAQKLTERYGL